MASIKGSRLIVDIGVALLTLQSATGALAQPADEPPVSVEGTVEVVSDYRFRGVSLSGGRPALQAGITLASRAGPYLDVWASLPASHASAHDELDAVIGYRFSIEDVEVDVAVARYAFPGADFSYVELPVSVSHSTGKLTLSLTAAYVPPQGTTDGRANWYASARGDWRLGRLTLSASTGYENGVFADDKIDWLLGARLQFGRLTVGLNYVGYAARGVNSAPLLSAELSF